MRIAGRRNLGCDYVYIGQKGDFSGSGLRPGWLSKAKDVTVVYLSAMA